MFVQCIMPDESDRIRKSTIKSMMNFLLMFAVFNRETSILELESCHPTMAIVFNNVSKYTNFTLVCERIEKYKELLREDAVQFYCHKISDDTLINEKKWKDLKKSVIQSNYEQEPWFLKLLPYDRKLIESLHFAQSQLKEPLAPLKLIDDPLLKKEIEDKIDVLL